MWRPGALGAVLDAGDADAIRVREPARVVELVTAASLQRKHRARHRRVAVHEPRTGLHGDLGREPLRSVR